MEKIYVKKIYYFLCLYIIHYFIFEDVIKEGSTFLIKFDDKINVLYEGRSLISSKINKEL